MIVDAHNDLLLELVLSREEGRFGDLVLRTGDERLFDRYWLPLLKAGGVGIQVCPLYAARRSTRILASACSPRRPSSAGRYRRTRTASARSAPRPTSTTRACG